MKAAGTSVFILLNGNLFTEHHADPDSWDTQRNQSLRYKFMNFLSFAHH